MLESDGGRKSSSYVLRRGLKNRSQELAVAQLEHPRRDLRLDLSSLIRVGVVAMVLIHVLLLRELLRELRRNVQQTARDHREEVVVSELHLVWAFSPWTRVRTVSMISDPIGRHEHLVCLYQRYLRGRLKANQIQHRCQDQ